MKTTKRTAAPQQTTIVKKVAPAAAEPAKKKDWFMTGQQGFEKKHQLDAAHKLRQEKGIRRFRLQANEEANIVFVDNEGFFVLEHQVAPGGRWQDSVYLTCTREFEACPVCQSGHKPIFTCYFTIIDMRKYTKKDGTESTHRKVLMPIKGTALQVIEELKKDHGDLTGLAFKVRRLGKDDPNCGRDFKKLGRYNIVGKLGAEMAVPYKYKEILAPPAAADFQAAGLVVPKSVGSSEDVDAELEEGGGEDVEAMLD